MMQAGVCLRRDTETTLPELTEEHRIRQKEELSGLESVHMAESETECAATGLNTLEPECVTAHSGIHHATVCKSCCSPFRCPFCSPHFFELAFYSEDSHPGGLGE
ncbi:hypothetical protein SKAU_G00115700 [Synaphobranchus kaupii]|uniref:Uncharacterized protein n=1 Tax=Synaphobranchus kaupii TaxID=118154 RepID=A0A9Q1FMT3_SYNKA|nr:hypothetical protein SKAU_G00115700 [Synaphobranchus kaupii]